MAVTMSKNQIALIDVALVTISTDGTNEIALNTSSQVSVEPQITTTEDNILTNAYTGAVIARKPGLASQSSTTITLTDNVFNPELVQILQGGTITYDTTVPTKFRSYTPPVSGSSEHGVPFTLKTYSVHYDSAGVILGYVMMTYPNCQGQPLSFGAQADTWNAPSYTISSAPSTGDPAYEMEYVDSLPTITSA